MFEEEPAPPPPTPLFFAKQHCSARTWQGSVTNSSGSHGTRADWVRSFSEWERIYVSFLFFLSIKHFHWKANVKVFFFLWILQNCWETWAQRAFWWTSPCYDTQHISACGAGEGSSRGAAKHILMCHKCAERPIVRRQGGDGGGRVDWVLSMRCDRQKAFTQIGWDAGE